MSQLSITESAKAAAQDAIESLWTVYDAESFDHLLVESMIVAAILPFLQNVRPVESVLEEDSAA